jgi:uncharacterized RDD family membrane protein YckC
MQDNPYAPTTAVLNIPAASPDEAASVGELPLALRRHRFLNSIIDSVAYTLFCGLIGAILGATHMQSVLQAVGPFPNNYIFAAVLMLLYYVPTEKMFGCTPGKLLTGTRVVSLSGGPTTFRQILVRTMCRWIPLEAFTFLSPKRYGLHDRLSNTRVIKRRG